MDVKQRSFWSTTSGLVTGLAGVLTAVVGLVTAGAQLGWFGSDDSGDNQQTVAGSAPSTAPGTGPGGTTGTTARSAPGGLLGTTTAAPSRTPLSATPANLSLDTLANREKVVTIANGGSSSIPLRTPAVVVEGLDASQFTTSNVTCGSRLDVNRTCEVKVTYQATRPGQHSAKLVIQPTDSTPALEVPLSGSRPLL